ncbi:hypothetical protein [Chryseobacterium sp. RLHN22]|uniref:hypothetical protein n=1 Tax=Chryseobacterium sp. RLHN22 TaxID=3437885 RepID=UPI003D9B8285
MNNFQQYRIIENGQLKLHPDYLFAYSYSDGFTEHLFGFDLLIENSGKTHFYSSGFMLDNKYEVIPDIPKFLEEFLFYLDENPIPFENYSFDYGICITDIGSQQIFINWNHKSYYFFIEGNKAFFLNDDTSKWKTELLKLQKKLLKFALQERKLLISKGK